MRRNDSDNRKPIQIEKRDRLLIQALDDYGLLSTEQVRHLFFPSLNRARKRLHLLWQHGLVRRIVRPTRLGEGTKSLLFRSSPKGRRLTRSPGSSNSGNPRSANPSPLYAEHQLAVNRFRICLELALKKSADSKLGLWKKDGQLRLKVRLQSNGHVRTTTVIPDAFFTIHSDGIRYGYFLEIDRGTSPISRCRTKLLAFASIFSDPKAYDPLIPPGFRVLIVTNGARRQENLLSLIRGLSTAVKRRDIFMVTCHNEFDYEAPEDLFSPIWKVVHSDCGNSGEVSLQPNFQRSRQRQVNHQCAVQNPISRLGTGPGG
jgi:hypothetical protein